MASNLTTTNSEIESSTIVWLDANVNKTDDNRITKQKLCVVVNQCETFAKEKQCESFLRSFPTTGEIIFIVSGRLGQKIIPKIHAFKQIVTIYIFCSNKQKYLQLAESFAKVLGVFTIGDDLIEQIRADYKSRQVLNNEKNLSMSFCREPLDLTRWVIEPNNYFVISQALFDCLLQTEITEEEQSQFRSQWKTESGEDYATAQALACFMGNSNLSTQLKDDLQHRRIQSSFPSRLLFRDIQRQIETHQCQSSTDVYRTQRMTTGEVKLLQQHQNCLIMFNGCLSTIKNRRLALASLFDEKNASETHQVLFHISADPKSPGVKAFSDGRSMNYSSEQDVFFSFGSVFRLIDIYRDESEIWIAEMILASFDATQLSEIYNYVQQQSTYSIASPFFFGIVLQNLYQYEQAKRHYQHVQNTFTNHSDIIQRCHVLLNTLEEEKHDYDRTRAIIEEDSEPKITINELHSALNFSHRAKFFYKNNQYQKALENDQKSLFIWRKLSGQNHLEMGRCFYRMGVVYQQEKNYQTALDSYKKALPILQSTLSPKHQDVNIIHCNIIDVYRLLGQEDEAMNYCMHGMDQG